MFITAHELDPLDLPHYQSDCVLIAKSPDDWPMPPRPTWDGIYHLYMNTGDYIFVMPELAPGTIPEGQVFASNLVKLVFSTKVCALCELTGFSTKPDFWIDLE